MHRTYPRAATRLALKVLVLVTIATASVAGAQPAMNAGSEISTSDLEALVREAMVRNPSVIAALNRWQALQRVPIQARTPPDPQVQLQEFTVGSPKPGAGYERSDFYYTGFGASQDIPFPGKLRLAGEVAEKEAEVARRQYEAAQREAGEKVREDYFELFYLSKTITLLQAEQNDLTQIGQIAEDHYRVGQSQAQDVLKAQLEATRMLDLIEHHHREMQQHQIDLKAALGRDLDSANVAIADVQPTRVDLSQEQVAHIAEGASPDIQMDRAMEARNEKALGLAHKGYGPDFTVGYSYEKTGPGFRDYYMLTLGAKIPLYFWRKQTPAIEQAELDLAAARSQTRGHMLEVGSLAEDQLVAIRTSARVLKLYQEGLIPQAENSMQAALSAYRVSKADFQTLISAFVDVRSLKEEYYRELADHEIAVAKLEQIVGDVK
jgi:outer membrane protein, heavy metal efflux system